MSSKLLPGLLLGALAGGCAPAAAPDGPPIAAVHRTQCGRCHTAPAPQAHPRPYLEVALDRHRRRVHLSPGDWSSMLDYLAARAY